MIWLADSEGTDQTVRMRRLIGAFIVRICQKTRFRVARPEYYCMLVPPVPVILPRSYAN